jgi:hypothetical protein
MAANEITDKNPAHNSIRGAQNAVSTAGEAEQLPADILSEMAKDGGKGLSFDREDQVRSIVKITQSGSPALDLNDPSFIEEAEPRANICLMGRCTIFSMWFPAQCSGPGLNGFRASRALWIAIAVPPTI